MVSLIFSIIFALGFMAMGLTFLFWSVTGIKREHQRSRPSTFIDIIFGVVFLMGIAILVFAVSFPKIASDSQGDLNKYRTECTNAGGVVIDLDGPGPECWKNKISELY